MITDQRLTALLRVFIEMGTKPNYSELARTYGMDRRTVKKIYENGGTVKRKKKKQFSRWDPYESLIRDKMALSGITIRGLHEYLREQLGDEEMPGTYESLKAYIRKKDIPKPGKDREKAHVLFETEKGRQLQVDWIENLTMNLEDGSEETFNIFSATLGWSRKHVYVYSKTKTTEDFKRCLLTVFKRLGGLPAEVLTDNMSAIVNCSHGKKTVNPKISQMFKDLGVKLNLCKVRTPQTKGKCESANRFRSWIVPYESDLKSPEDIRNLIDNILTHRVNEKINETTGMPPNTLYLKEMEYLQPLPSSSLLEMYLEDVETRTVPSTLLVYYKGKKYSVPEKFIGRKVQLHSIENQLFIYCQDELIATHSISKQKINYHPDHYVEGLAGGWRSECDIKEAARKNLSMFKETWDSEQND